MSLFTSSGLSSSAIEVLGQLFVKGPTWDGNIVSKAGRGELCQAGLAFHAYGWASLTAEGIRTAIESQRRCSTSSATCRKPYGLQWLTPTGVGMDSHLLETHSRFATRFTRVDDANSPNAPSRRNGQGPADSRDRPSELPDRRSRHARRGPAFSPGPKGQGPTR